MASAGWGKYPTRMLGINSYSAPRDYKARNATLFINNGFQFLSLNTVFALPIREPLLGIRGFE